MLGAGTFITGSTLALFYLVLSWSKNNIKTLESAFGRVDNMHLLIGSLFITGIIVLIVARAAAISSFGIKTGSTQIAIASLAINASLFIPESYMRPYMTLILFILSFGYALWGVSNARECAEKLSSTKKFAWAYSMTELVIMAFGIATIFSIMTLPPIKS